MLRLTKNTFSSGLNTDVDPQALRPEFYTDAHNVTLIGDGSFFGIKDFAGTLPIGDVTGGIVTNLESNIRAVYCKFKIGDVSNVNCLVNFITARQAGDLGAFYITCYDLDNDVLYYLYQETGLPTTYFNEHRIVDARIFPENGLDFIYFSDGYSEMRQLRCEIPTGSIDYFLSAYDLSLQRRGGNGTVQLSSITQTGTLLTGTYQYAYRMVDATAKRFTKWSSLTDPIHVYQQAQTSGQQVYSSVGASTSFAVNLTITPTAEELANFSYYQLAVIENIYPVTSPVQPASLLTIQAISGSSASFSHRSNEKIGLITIEDLVVDLAALQSVKTLGVKQGRLFGGNVQYKNLEFDNGEPAASGSIIVDVGTDDSFNDHAFSSTKLGYFRDETYRFGIVYRDKYGNKSPVKTLDLNAITDNQISGSLTDVHFPGRNVSNSYTLFDGSGNLRSLGLGLTNIHNHPTWAVGFEIVRAKRIKRILFQTPIVPMYTVTGIGAFDDYPSQSTTTATSAHVQYPDAQPQINLPVYVPKNLFWPEPRNIRLATQQFGAGTTLRKIGEAILTTRDKNFGFTVENPYYQMIFPPASMYGAATPYNFGEFEKIETVDYCIAQTFVNDFVNHATFAPGDFIHTQISGTWAALNDGDYYFDSAWSAKTIDPAETGIKNYVFQDNLSAGTTLSGNKIMQYSLLQGVGVDWGYQPTVQRSAVIEMTTAVPEPITLGGLAFANGFLNNWDPLLTSGPWILDSAGPQYVNPALVTNDYINQQGAFVNNSSYTQAFRIVNVINDIGDERYGDVDDPHEFISTGASYFFDEAELATVQVGGLVNIDLDVFGGDCFVAPNTFKVADGAYSVVNQGKPFVADSATTLLEKWGGRFYFNHGTGAALSLPIGVEGASQFVQIVLESEYNGGVTELDIFDGTQSVSGIAVKSLASIGALRSPLTYKYNPNISKQNDQKVYLTRQPFSFEQSTYKARVVYSDLKIYNSDIQGFDIFRVGNFTDLEENKGAITKLAMARDNLYAIQETGVVYLPTSQAQLQQTDAGILAVGTGDVISRPIVIDQARGGQHMNAVIETGAVIFFPDNINKNVYILQEQAPLRSINELNVDTTFGTLFEGTIPENQLVGVRDPFNREFWLVDNANNKCYVFSEKVSEQGTWMSNYEFYDADNSLSSKCVAGIAGNNNLYLVGDKTVSGYSELTSHAMYKGPMHSHFGVTVTPRVSFVVNPDSDISKTFDNQAFVTTNRLDSIDRTVERETELGPQVSPTQSLDVPPVEGNYRRKTLRDSAGARLRGLRMLCTVFWKTGSTDSATLSSVLTKYRWSARSPF
jgi:hypothetical protein